MSTDYRPIQNIRFSDLFDGRLERLGVREGVTEETGLTSRRCLTDGRYYVWVYKNSDDEFVDRLVLYRLFNLPGMERCLPGKVNVLTSRASLNQNLSSS